MHFLKRFSAYAAAGGLGALLVFGVSGCEKKEQSTSIQKEGATVVIQEVSPGNYKIVEETPSSTTRVILRDSNGSERLLSQAEIDKIVRAEAQKIEQNQSPLVNPTIHNQGFSLGEAILASAVGAIIGSWIGSRLFQNPTYQKQRKSAFKSPSAYQRSVQNFQKRALKPTTKSGFFSSKSKSLNKSYFSFGG